MTTLKQSYQESIKKIINKLEVKIKKNGITENYGQEQLRLFNDRINQDDRLTYADKAELSSELVDKINNIEIK